MSRSFLALLFLLIPLFIAAPALQAADTDCPAPGQWLLPNVSGAVSASTHHVAAQLSQAHYVLLGEAHNNAAHHFWQLQSLAMVLGSGRELVIGMEMFPRRVQPALDRWVAGELTEREFLEQSEWYRVWRFDAELYLPILRFARMNRVPLVALNVDRKLTSDTAKQGWDAIDPARREVISDPAPATQEYREWLQQAFDQHPEEYEANFEFFVQAQLVWDRAFAQALRDAHARHPNAVIAGIIGSGHLRYGHGVPHQLRALGADHIRVWLPLDHGQNCSNAEIAGIADAVFATGNMASASPPMLGVFLRDEDGKTSISNIVPDSVAERAGLKGGDRILNAAGVVVNDSSEVVKIVRQLLPGTWLPLTIERDGKTMEIVARFPPPGTVQDTHGTHPATEEP